MKIAIDTSPVSKSSSSAHKVRGVGSYINMLKGGLPKFDQKNEYYFVEDKKFPGNIDLIHFPYFDPFFVTLPLRSNKKFIVTVHDLTPLVFPEKFPPGIKGSLMWGLQKRLLKKASAIITDSDCSKNDIIRIAGVPEGKVNTVYLAADEKFKKLKPGKWEDQIRKKYGIPEKFLLYVGDATWNKNIPNLIEAVKKTKYKLVLIGKVWEGISEEISPNPWNEDLNKALSESQSDQFFKLGFVEEEDLVRIYNLASLLVLPSRYEGFGLPVLEAFCTGCPVITTKGGSLPEIAGNAVYYVEPENSASIAEGIVNLMEDEKLLSEFISRGFAQKKKFSTKSSIEGLTKVYESIS